MNIIQIQVPTPFDVGCVNAYLIDSETPTLVDCGPRTEEAWAALVAGIEAAGHRVEQIERLILTHSHIDHGGLANRIRRVSGCAVLAHPVDHPLLQDVAGTWQSGVVDFWVESCRRAGVPAPQLSALGAELWDHRRYTESTERLTPLEEGDTVLFPEGRLEVLHTPGHTRGCICLWDREGGRLLSGDTLIPHISSNALLAPGVASFREKSLLRYVESLERILALGGLFLLPGHGDAMPLPQSLISERFEFYERRAERIRHLVGEGADCPWLLAERLFPDTDPGKVFLTVSEVVGHLDLLESRGRVHFEGEDAPWRVRAPVRLAG